MYITKKLMHPSRPDAVRLKRSEKLAMLHLMYAASILADIGSDIPDRLKMIPDGEKRLKYASGYVDELLEELRVTIPENQRIGMQNTALDCEMRITPKSLPSENNVIVTKEEFRELVDCARIKCSECADDEEECVKCRLFQLLTSILPLEDYDGVNLCPYNLGRWAN